MLGAGVDANNLGLGVPQSVAFGSGATATAALFIRGRRRRVRLVHYGTIQVASAIISTSLC